MQKTWVLMYKTRGNLGKPETCDTIGWTWAASLRLCITYSTYSYFSTAFCNRRDLCNQLFKSPKRALTFWSQVAFWSALSNFRILADSVKKITFHQSPMGLCGDVCDLRMTRRLTSSDHKYLLKDRGILMDTILLSQHVKKQMTILVVSWI